MAVSLVIDVWRNGPVEDMHCGKRGLLPSLRMSMMATATVRWRAWLAPARRVPGGAGGGGGGGWP